MAKRTSGRVSTRTAVSLRNVSSPWLVSDIRSRQQVVCGHSMEVNSAKGSARKSESEGERKEGGPGVGGAAEG